MSGEALRIIKAVYNQNGSGYGAGNTTGTKSSKGLPKNGQSEGVSVPSFGIKGRKELTQDMFQYKGETLTKEQVQAKTYSDVYKHEAAHLSKAGKYAASGINIHFDGNGFAVGGHVNIKMPTLNPDNLDQTIEHATAVIASAEAPASFDELSDADKNVAAKARAVKAQALSMKGNQSKAGGNRLNYIA